MEKEIEQLREQLKKQETLASLGMLSAGIAHEIQNPLNFVINFSKTNCFKISPRLLRTIKINSRKTTAMNCQTLLPIFRRT